MKLAIDLDDVLVDFANPFSAYIKKKYNIKLNNRHFYKINWAEEFGWDKKRAISSILEFLKSPEFDDLKPIPGAQDGVEQLKKYHDLVVVTGRPKEVLEQSKSWLEKYFTFMFSEVYATDFHIVRKGRKGKGELCREKGVEAIIEDFPDYGQECLDAGIKVYLFSRPWNNMLDLPEEMIRVESWTEIVDKLSFNEKAGEEALKFY